LKGADTRIFEKFGYLVIEDWLSISGLT